MPIVACDQIFPFSVPEWVEDLQKALGPALPAKRDKDTLSESARELFNQTVTSVQNIGVNDAHRALNFLLMRHPGVFLAVAQRRGNAVLYSLDTARQLRGFAEVANRAGIIWGKNGDQTQTLAGATRLCSKRLLRGRASTH